MAAELINAFIKSVASVLPQVIPNINFKRGQVKIDGNAFTSPQPTEVALIVLGLIGQYKGRLLLKFDGSLAKEVAGAMLMMGGPVEEFDSLAQSALGELGNMLAGTASTILSQQNINIDFSPPTVVIGKELHLDSFKKPPIVIPLVAQSGKLDIGLALD